MAPTTKSSCIVLFSLLHLEDDLDETWQCSFLSHLFLSPWLCSRLLILLGLGAGCPAVAQWGLVPCTFQWGWGDCACCQGGNVCLTHVPQGSLVCACDAMSLAISSHPWAGAGVGRSFARSRAALVREDQRYSQDWEGVSLTVTWQSMKTGRWLSSPLPVSTCICNFLAILRLEPPYVGRLQCNWGVFLTLPGLSMASPPEDAGRGYCHRW